MVEPTEQTIYNWWNHHLVDTGRRARTPSIENSELLAALRRIAELEKELVATRRAQRVAATSKWAHATGRLSWTKSR